MRDCRRKPLFIFLFAAAAAEARANTAPEAVEGGGPRVHVVDAGQSLWTISRQYGCGVADLRHANRMDGSFIMAGQELVIPVCQEQEPGRFDAASLAVSPRRGNDGAAAIGAGPTAPGSAAAAGIESAPVRHLVAAGDTLDGLAHRYRTSIAEIQIRNDLAGTVIYAGQLLEIAPGTGERTGVVLGQSIGWPQDGRLASGVQLPSDAAYYRRRPHYAWGSSHVVQRTRQAIGAVRRRFPGVHRLAVGDLSARRGGKIPQHRSHQSGRDVDLGLYFKRTPRGYPEEFVAATVSDLDYAANWTLVKALAASADLPGGVERIYLDYHVQQWLFDWARRQRVSPRLLAQLFQYPRGRDAAVGLIRHAPGHEDHYHVRFRCPARDRRCHGGE